MRRERTRVGIPLDPDETLYEFGSREVWQSTLITSDHQEVGPVIRQVVEPGMYTIRYFVVYDMPRSRHILVPSNAVIDISDAKVYCSLSLAEVEAMPSFVRAMDRGYEQEVYEAAGRTPHWVEEQAVNSSSRNSDD